MSEPPAFGPPFASYQAEIFLRGMAGETPPQPVAIAALAEAARAQIGPREADYVFGAAGSEDTMRVHADGELALARAAGSVGLPMVVSTVSSHPLEAIAAQGGGPKWFQLNWPSDRRLAASLVSRAEAAGYEAVIVTVDTVVPGWKPRDLQAARQPVLEGIGTANYVSDPVFRGLLERSPEEDPQAAVGQFVMQFSNPKLTWADLEFLRSRTTLPMALKGILHPDDARAAREHGMDAVIVSNHGGRQVDGAIARAARRARPHDRVDRPHPAG